MEKTDVKNKRADIKRRSKLSTAFQLLRNYGLNRLTGKPSTAGFWWLSERTRVGDPHRLKLYLESAQPSPHYLMDYASKLSYQYKNDDGIIVLPYNLPVGDQINPEAAFIYALAVHDAYLQLDQHERRKEFLYYADYFRKAQLDNGDWPYLFDWPGSKAPWVSALAQGRGASVMTRAFLMTKEESYKDAAIKAISHFDLPVAEGGYMIRHRLTGLPYYEEYPSRPIGVMNGFMASLLGCWEVAHWLGDEKARQLFDQGIVSLIEMTPHYMTQWWSVYDRNPDVKSPNLNTPRYHKLVLSYFEILSVLSNNPQLAVQRDKWRECLGPVNETRAMVLKFKWKLSHGVFSS